MSTTIDWQVLATRALPQAGPAGGDEAAPSWAAVLQEVLAEIAQAPAGTDSPDEAAGDAVPFSQVYDPFVRVALRKLAARSPSGWEHLSPAARDDLDHALRARLSYLCGQALELEFSLFRVAGRSSLACLSDEFHDASPAGDDDRPRHGDVDSDGPARELYQAFLAKLSQGGLADFLFEYCVLARLAGTTLVLFVDTFTEFLCRLERDRDQIHRFFGTGEAGLGPVVRIHAYLSDLHCGGQAVSALSFAAGLSILYKPKYLGMDQAFSHVLQWLNERSGLLPLRSPRILHREDYGWVEFVRSRPCLDRTESGRYFRRAGMLLCLAYVLAGIDLHHENIINDGEDPVLIDLEMLLAPRLRNWAHSRPHAGGFNPGSECSVLQTGLLPHHTVDPDGVISDVSGLGAGPDVARGFRVPRWSHVNTDRMAIMFPRGRGERLRRDLVRADVDLPLVEHEDDLRQGFESMYAVLLRLREPMLAPGGPLAGLPGKRTRIVLRPTQIYDLMLSRSLRPECLRDAAARSAELGLLARCFPTDTASSPLLPVIRDEVAALERVDVPVFSAAADSEDLSSEAGTTIRGALAQSGYREAVERLSGLGERDLARQVAFIRGAVGAKAAAARGVPFLSAQAEQRGVPTADDLISAARAVGDDLRARAIVGEDGATWTGPYYDEGRFRPLPMGYGTYDGTAGVALFLAALHQQTGEPEYGQLARDALRPLSRNLRLRQFGETAAAMGPGGAAGFAALSYALVRTSAFLGDPALVDDAMRVANLLSKRLIRGLREADVIAGASGTLLSLLSLHSRTNDAGILAKAVDCGDVLLDERALAPTGMRSWRDSSGAFLTGFSHGAAGICYALLRLYAVTGDAELRRAALDGIAHETALFDRARGNWPDLRLPADDGSGFGTSWCQGAPGIGLARLACADLGAAVGPDIDAAISTTVAVAGGENDQLCCGAMGRTELLLSAARRRGRPELEHAALEIAGSVLRRAERSGSFGFGLKGTVDNPALFQGAAGIGYQLLRLAAPEKVPSLLLWE